MTAGFLLVIAGLLLLLVHEHFAARKAWDRPDWSRAALYRRLFRPAAWGILLIGVAFLLSSSRVVGVVIAAILLGSWAWTRWVRSASHLARELRAGLLRLRSEQPGRREEELLCALVLARHPRWGEDLAGQIAAEHKDVRRLAEILIRMERSGSGGLPEVRRPRTRDTRGV